MGKLIGGIMRIETKEDLIIDELKQVHESLDTYINDTIKLLMAHGMSEQEAKRGILKRFKDIFKPATVKLKLK